MAYKNLENRRKHMRENPELMKKARDYFKKRYANDSDFREKRNSKAKEYLRNKRTQNSEFSRSIHLKQNYGLTLGEYQVLLDSQNSVCAICGKKQISQRFKYLSVDHSHTTGKVRGLLCNQCNQSLGLLKENKETLKAMIKYIEKFESA